MKNLAASILTCFAFATMSARAALTVSLDAPVVNAGAGTVLVFNGTFTNTDPVDRVFLNDVQISAPAGITLQPNAFFTNVPGILLPGETYTGPIFSVVLGAAATANDYNASLTVSGGADISATGTLSTKAFTVLSPAVTIVVPTPEASEFGPVSGAFTVSRTGGTDIPLSVNYTIGGTAGNGSACLAILPSVILGAGISSTNVAVTPIPNNTPDGDRSVLLTLVSSTNYNLGASVAGTVTIHDKPVDQWRLQNFGVAANTLPAADAASWSSDGVANMVKYGLGLNPTVANAWELPGATMVNGYLTLSFVPSASATDVAFLVEGCPDLATWSAANVELVTLANPVPPNRLTYRYRLPVGAIDGAFLRLRIGRLP